MKVFLLIRIRGRIGISPENLDTMDRLNIPKKHNAAIITDDPSIMGMVNKVGFYVTWGEISKDALVALLQKRGRLPGEAKLTDDALKANNLGSIEAVADKILAEGKVPEPIKRTFRLTPPSGGFKHHITRHIKSGGELGYRGADINALIAKMI
ncbi:MAG TPA: 50S ribosomal protein L30 [Candidatus Methanomethylicus sp.]|jgi:large subunit ribosomal protein L30|nr:50S ribosomal protein L30 [Candidatus Methanomethylicus sp.]